MDLDKVNELTASLVRQYGKEIAAIGELDATMVCLEGVTAGLLIFIAAVFNKQPDELVDRFCEGVRERKSVVLNRQKQ